MERFKKVLEHSPSLGAVHDSAPVELPFAPQEGQDLRVVYTQTRTVQVATEVLHRNRVISGLDDPAISGAYKLLRTQVLQRMRSNGWNTLAVTSASPGEGKTLTAVNLAISLAKAVNHAVLLVDLDLRRPSVARYFGHEPAYGLRDYLLDDVPLNEILFTPQIDRLSILPGGKPLNESSELLAAPKMVRLAQELKSRYDGRIVVFDMPPLLVADDVLAFAPCVDAVLFVVQEGKTQKAELQNAMAMLKHIPLVGTVLNRAEDAHAAYY